MDTVFIYSPASYYADGYGYDCYYNPSAFSPAHNIIRARGDTPVLTALPSFTGGVTAKITSFAGLRANADDPGAAYSMAAMLLDEDIQLTIAHYKSVFKYPVNKRALQAVLREWF